MIEKCILSNFKIRPAYTCISGLIRDVLYYHGLDIDESLIFGLSKGWLFRYGYSNDDIFSTSIITPRDKIVVEDGIFDLSILHNCIKSIFGFEVREIFTDDVDEIWKIIIDELAKNNIPLVAVYSEKLEYFPKTLRTQHGHFIAVYGYDLSKSCIYIGDVLIPSVPKTIYQGEISIENFFEAIKLRIDKIKIKVGVWVLYKTKPYNGIASNLYEAALQGIIQQNINNTSVNYFNQGTVNCGIYAIEKFRQDLLYLTSTNNSERNILFNNSEALYSGIISRGGSVVARKQIAEFIMIFQRVVGIDFSNIIDRLNVISKNWNIVANVFIRLGFTKDILLCNKALDIIAKIICLEKETLEMLNSKLEIMTEYS